MKRKGVFVLIVIIVALIIYIVNPFEVEMPKFVKKTSDYTESVVIGERKIDATYYSGNMLDTSISYGNSLEKIIKIQNKNDELLSYSIGFSESAISNKDLKYKVEISTRKNQGYDLVVPESELTSDYNLKYNLGIEGKTTLYIRITFKSYNEETTTTLKGKISIKPNLSKKEVVFNNIVDINNAINTKIEELNGIRNPGYYIIGVNELTIKDLNVNGLVVVDATNIASTNNTFYVYSDNNMVYNYKFSKKFAKANIKPFDGSKGFDWDTVCLMHTKKGCSPFSSLTYNEGGSKKDFKDSIEKVLEAVKKDFDHKNKNVVIYDATRDITNDTNVRGYILINNTNTDPEYYLYLTNDIFFVSGYNTTKLGPVSTETVTIRAYVPEAFEVSASSISKVCSFTGFTNCQDKAGNIIN